MTHHFDLRATWTGALDGTGQLIASGTELQFSAPAALGGKGIGTNPEELLLGAASTCFLITLAAVMKRMSLPSVLLRLRSELVVAADSAPQVKTLRHFPKVDVSAWSDEKVASFKKALFIAEQACLVAKAIKGNVNVEVVVE